MGTRGPGEWEALERLPQTKPSLSPPALILPGPPVVALKRPRPTTPPPLGVEQIRSKAISIPHYFHGALSRHEDLSRDNNHLSPILVSIFLA